jgi:antitoxin VapB
MGQTKAKLFNNGRSQAVRLPAAFRFEGSEVYIKKDPETGDVVLSKKPDSWDEFFALVKAIPDSEKKDFLKDRGDAPPQRRNIF